MRGKWFDRERMDLEFSTTKKEGPFTRATLEMTDTTGGGGLHAILGNLEMACTTGMGSIQRSITTTKGFFKRHSRMVKESASRGKILQMEHYRLSCTALSSLFGII
jgi:hypothetical protein